MTTGELRPKIEIPFESLTEWGEWINENAKSSNPDANRAVLVGSGAPYTDFLTPSIKESGTGLGRSRMFFAQHCQRLVVHVNNPLCPCDAG